MNFDLSDFQVQLDKAFDLTLKEVGKIHTGRASSSLIEDVKVDAYEGSTPLRIIELGTITTEPQALIIQLFDSQVADKVAKAIMEANLGLTPNVAGNTIRINIPPLSQERRLELAKVIKHKVENGKVLIRQARREIMNQIKDMFEANELTEDEVKRLEKQVQDLVDEYNYKLDDLGQRKEAEVMTV